MKKYILITLILLTSIATFAQTPGFAGKRFSVHAGMGITPALYNVFYDNDDFAPITTLPGIGVNVTPAFSAEYVLSKGVVAGGGLMFNKLNMPMTYFEDNRDGFNDYEAHGFFGETKVKSKYWNLYLKFYRYQKNGSIAPIGRFHQLEFIKGSTTVENGDVVLTNADYNDLYLYLGNNSNYYFESFDMIDDVTKIGYTDPVKLSYIKYAYGFETVLFDKIAATMSVQISYPLGLLMLDTYYEDEAEGEYISKLQNRSYGAIGFSMNLGLGYFVF